MNAMSTETVAILLNDIANRLESWAASDNLMLPAEIAGEIRDIAESMNA